ncbi:flavin reductase family protein [Arthrobacter sp. Helios]|uniref:flavin reductase family protein n=1 Tax=Arthrobacter sp. Helios TaxID=2828862 RepID=UPI002049B094|nr:flavin reductase family protein [Arthrobacter sp. Helios]UPO76278.1 flavin reductase family protein [Arthrobacter sp. Helios]
MTAELLETPVAGPIHQAGPADRIDPVKLRNTFGNFTTGVTIVSYEHNGEVLGATVNSFTSVSLDPPLVLVSLMKTAKAAALLADKPFSINVLGKDQLSHALQFAGKPQDGLEIDWNREHTSPRIAGSMAWFSCEPWQQYDGGDHVLILGKVAAFGHVAGDDAEPLVFYRGGWRGLA